MPARRARLGRGVPPVGCDHMPPVSGGLVLGHAPGRCPTRSQRSPWPACGCGPCSSQPGPRSRSRHGRGPGGCWPCGGNRCGRRGPSGAPGQPWPWPWPGSRTRAGSGTDAAGSGPGSVPGGPGWRGLAIFSPPEVTAKSLMPRSTPTALPAAGSCSGSATSTAKETYQRPQGSRETVTVDGSIDAGSIPGQDQSECQRRVHLGEEQRAVAVPEPGPGELRGLPAGAGLIPRVAGAAGEEAGVRDLLVPDRLLKRDRGHLVQPRQFFGGFHGSQVGVRLGEVRLRLLAAVIPGVPPRKRPVPHDADASERAVQHAGLLRCRVRPALVRSPHKHQAYPV